MFVVMTAGGDPIISWMDVSALAAPGLACEVVACAVALP
jgi:hypothetical protein